MEELEKINEKVKSMLQEVFDFALENTLKKLEEKSKEILKENLDATQEAKILIDTLRDEMKEKFEELREETEKQFIKMEKIYKNKFLFAIILFSISLLINVIILVKIFLK